MNLPDGRVQVWAEGSREAIEALRRALERGPRLARVDRVAVTWRQPSGCWPTFTIRSEAARGEPCIGAPRAEPVAVDQGGRRPGVDRSARALRGRWPPASGATSHEVKRSETLSGIARQYGVSVREIVSANRLARCPRARAPGRKSADHSRREERTARGGDSPGGRAQRPRAKRASLRSTSAREFFSLPPANLLLAIPDFPACRSRSSRGRWMVRSAPTSGGAGRAGIAAWTSWRSEGTPIHAAAAGVVIASGIEPRYGRVVKIEHDGGFVTVYAHNLANSVEVGHRVAAGQEIGNVGADGTRQQPAPALRDPPRGPRRQSALPAAASSSGGHGGVRRRARGRR